MFYVYQQIFFRRVIEAHGSFDLQALDTSITEEIVEINEDFEVLMNANDDARAVEPLPTVPSPQGRGKHNDVIFLTLISLSRSFKKGLSFLWASLKSINAQNLRTTCKLLQGLILHVSVRLCEKL